MVPGCSHLSDFIGFTIKKSIITPNVFRFSVYDVVDVAERVVESFCIQLLCACIYLKSDEVYVRYTWRKRGREYVPYSHVCMTAREGYRVCANAGDASKWTEQRARRYNTTDGSKSQRWRTVRNIKMSLSATGRYLSDIVEERATTLAARLYALVTESSSLRSRRSTPPPLRKRFFLCIGSFKCFFHLRQCCQEKI